VPQPLRRLQSCSNRRADKSESRSSEGIASCHGSEISISRKRCAIMRSHSPLGALPSERNTWWQGSEDLCPWPGNVWPYIVAAWVVLGLALAFFRRTVTGPEFMSLRLRGRRGIQTVAERPEKEHGPSPILDPSQQHAEQLLHETPSAPLLCGLFGIYASRAGVPCR